MGIEVPQFDKNFAASGGRRLLHEIGKFVADCIDLHDDVDFESIFFSELDDAVEDGFPILVAGEIVGGEEVVAYPLRVAAANYALDIVRGAIAGFAALHIDDAAEAARIRAAAPGVETSELPGIARDVALRQVRQGPIPKVRHVLHEIIKGRKTILVGRAENLLQTTLRLAREEPDTEPERLLYFGGPPGEPRQATP